VWLDSTPNPFSIFLSDGSVKNKIGFYLVDKLHEIQHALLVLQQIPLFGSIQISCVLVHIET